jgi:hypothetical protein
LPTIAIQKSEWRGRVSGVIRRGARNGRYGPVMTASLPPEGRRIGLIGKGGAGKSTIAGHLLAEWAAAGIAASAFDSDVPGEDEHGSLYEWAQRVDLGHPVYPTSAPPRLADEVRRLTPPHGIGLVDTGAWERRRGNAHFAVLAGSDLVVLALQPTPAEVERAGSVLAALEQIEAIGVHAPDMVILLTMVNLSAASAKDTRVELESLGLTVLATEIPRSDSRDGYAQSMARRPRAVPGSPMARLAAELLEEVTP